MRCPHHLLSAFLRVQNQVRHKSTLAYGSRGRAEPTEERLPTRRRHAVVTGKRREEETESKIHPFRELYPWESLSEFVDTLFNGIVFNDNRLVALNKPWGVGTHKAQAVVTKKNASFMSDVWGDPKYCIDDALERLSERLVLPGLKVVKALDRNMSGIILLTNDEKMATTIKQAGVRAKGSHFPFMSFYCITKGFPLIDSEEYIFREKVGISLTPTDEENKDKVSQIMRDYSKSKALKQEVKPVMVSTKILATNKQFPASFLEISTTSLKWHFLQCYAASKSSFILGDVRYANRVRDVFGAPILLSPHNVNAYDDREPLSPLIQETLKVSKNENIPLMVHRRAFTIPKYGGKGQDKDLTIFSNSLPSHFLWTLKKLGLNDSNLMRKEFR
jgi:23S rRNA-/tRNA-specific pseudouridylate synthase